MSSLQERASKRELEDSNFLEGMLQEATNSMQDNGEAEEWLFCPCEWVGTETQNLGNEIKAIVNNMKHVYLNKNPTEVHEAMASAYAHFHPGFLVEKRMTK